MDGSQQAPTQQGMPGGAGFPGGPRGGMRGGGFLPGGGLTGTITTVLLLLTCIVLAISFYQLFRKAGFPGVIGLLMLVPVVNLGVALYLAFAEWPVLAELKRVKLQLGSLEAAQTPAMPTPPAPAVNAGPVAAPSA